MNEINGIRIFLHNTKGHLISKCPFGGFKSPQNTMQFFQVKSKKYVMLESQIEILQLVVQSAFICPFLEARAEKLEKKLLVFGEV